MSGLKAFIKEVVSGVEKGDFRFNLLRWSKEEPYWCVFACECGKTGISAIEGIGGHYCIGKEENTHNVLSELVDSGWKVEIHQDFFR
jgi:hypothetical protein